LFDRLARLQAEFDNYRKRSLKEQESFRDFAISDLVKNLLPVIDHFDLALKAPGDVRSGVELIRRQLDEVLAKMGVRPIETIGQPFDPHQHEAIEMVPSDEAKDNHVIDELQRGYKLRDKLVRPAMVRVAQNEKKK
jgi:molecular chaperone GrpE